MAQTNNYPDDFKLLSHNVYMLPVTNWGQAQRADLIAQADYIKGYDVVILQEAFDNPASDQLLSGLKGKYPHQTPVLGRSQDGWDGTLNYGEVFDGKVEDGGVAVVSRWPIEQKVQYVFDRGCGFDATANKGFVYVKVNKEGRFYHVIGTHTQAEDSLCGSGKAAEIRRSQFRTIKKFIEDKNIPSNEIIFIGGDLNVNRNNRSEYSTMLTDLEANAPNAYAGWTATWDPATNGIANDNYPTLPAEYLDYILVAKKHAQPSFWHNQALDVPSPRWRVESVGELYEYKDYSDHYPVAAFAYADDKTPTQSFKAINKPYGYITLKNVGNNRYVQVDSSEKDGWLTIQADSSSEGKTHFNLSNWYYPSSSCISSEDYVKVESLYYPGYYWNWYGLGTGTGGYYPKEGDPSNRLRLEIINGSGSCLEDGDTVAFKDTDTLAGFKDKYVKRWPKGSWQDHLFLWSGSVGNDQKFVVSVSQPHEYQKWLSNLHYPS
ncbi:sphingomyelin phosphodiesterase [Microcoleus sp. AR_TQ3_B6]|uniref:sphingomyelin phosphodiesterase n=1 Tax=Microcoleus sp. AR_TQ3_B6 TaxID=3055284 RepID=UPI002FD348CB